eukprot:4443-Heterococcus_DN1.PRE.2
MSRTSTEYLVLMIARSSIACACRCASSARSESATGSSTSVSNCCSINAVLQRMLKTAQCIDTAQASAHIHSSLYTSASPEQPPYSALRRPEGSLCALSALASHSQCCAAACAAAAVTA